MICPRAVVDGERIMARDRRGRRGDEGTLIVIESLSLKGCLMQKCVTVPGPEFIHAPPNFREILIDPGVRIRGSPL